MSMKVFSLFCANPYKILIFLLLAVVIATSSPALAGEIKDGHSLLGRCKSVFKIGGQGAVLDRSETNNLMYCVGYFGGYTGMYYNTVMLDNFKTPPHCLPQGVNWKPLARIVVDFLEKHPELLHQPQEVLTTMALSEKFSCSSKAPQ